MNTPHRQYIGLFIAHRAIYLHLAFNLKEALHDTTRATGQTIHTRSVYSNYRLS